MLWFTIVKTSSGRHILQSATGHKTRELGEMALAKAKRLGQCDGISYPCRSADEARHWVDAQNSGMAQLSGFRPLSKS